MTPTHENFETKQNGHIFSYTFSKLPLCQFSRQQAICVNTADICGV